MAAADFRDLCQETVIWEHMTGRDSHGKPTYAAPITFSPFTSPITGGRRVFKSVRKSSGQTGIEFIQGSVIWLLATPNLTLEDLIYVSGDTDRPPILYWEQPADETGVAIHSKITLGSARG